MADAPAIPGRPGAAHRIGEVAGGAERSGGLQGRVGSSAADRTRALLARCACARGAPPFAPDAGQALRRAFWLGGFCEGGGGQGQ